MYGFACCEWWSIGLVDKKVFSLLCNTRGIESKLVGLKFVITAFQVKCLLLTARDKCRTKHVEQLGSHDDSDVVD